jgi:hypothetical protein
VTNQLTLGPLYLESCTSEHDHDICLVNTPDDIGSPILLATVFWDEDAPRAITLDRADAYARLFVAAPDLLDALREILDLAESGRHEEDFRAIASAAKTAIEKVI